jgi:hypothetical protein
LRFDCSPWHSRYEICSIIFVATTGYPNRKKQVKKKCQKVVKKVVKKLSGIVFSDRRRPYFQSCCFAGLTQSQLNQLFLAAVAGVWLGSAHHLSHSSVERGTLIIIWLRKTLFPTFNMDLRKMAKTLREGIEGSKGQQVVRLQQLNARANTSTETTAGNPTGDVQEQQWPPPPPPHLLQGGQQPPHPALPQGPKPAAPRTQQVPAIYRLAGPPLEAEARMTGLATLGAAPSATPRPTDPYSFTGPGYRHQPLPQFPEQEQAAFQQQLLFQQQPGGVFMGQGYSRLRNGAISYPVRRGDMAGWQRRLQATSWIPGNPYSGPALRGPGSLLLCVKLLAGAAGRLSTGCFLHLADGVILTIRLPCEGEEWMRANPREDQ